MLDDTLCRANLPVGWTYWSLPSSRNRLSRSARYLTRSASASMLGVAEGSSAIVIACIIACSGPPAAKSAVTTLSRPVDCDTIVAGAPVTQAR